MKKLILLVLMLALCIIPTLALAVEEESIGLLPELPEDGLSTIDESSDEISSSLGKVLTEAWEQIPLGGALGEDEVVSEPAPEEEPLYTAATPTSVIDGDMLLLYLEQYNTLLMLQVAVSVAAVIALLIATFSKEWIR